MQFDQLGRREFVTLIGGVAAWPLGARAEQSVQRPLIAFLFGTSQLTAPYLLTAFYRQMQALGYVEGRDYDTAFRFAEGDFTRLPELANELVRLRPDVIVTGNTTAAVAAKKATSVIPLVSAAMIEPVERGLVASHARPGANLTGILVSLDTLLANSSNSASNWCLGPKEPACRYMLLRWPVPFSGKMPKGSQPRCACS
jgi:putative ABC transport system substrate-binding protein